MATNISTIKINASRKGVGDALTKPELVKVWQYGSELITEWKVGGDIKFRSEWEGKVFEQWGKILKTGQDELIRYSLFAPSLDLEVKPINYFIMNYVLADENGQTKLEIIQEDNRPTAVQEELQGEESPFLQAFKKVAETN